MWDRRNLPLLVALCGSLLLHLLTIGGARTFKAGPDIPAWATRSHHAHRQERISISLLDPDERKSPPEKPKAPKAPKAPDSADKVPAVKPPPPPPPDIHFPEMGEKTGTGIGANQSPGEVPLHAREAEQDQAELSRHPGGGGKGGRSTADLLASSGEDGRGGQAGQEAMPAGPPPKPDASPESPSRAQPDGAHPNLAAASPAREKVEARNHVDTPPDRTDPRSKAGEPPVAVALASPPPLQVSIKGVDSGPTAVAPPPTGANGGKPEPPKSERAAVKNDLPTMPDPEEVQSPLHHSAIDPGDLQRHGPKHAGDGLSDELPGVVNAWNGKIVGAAFDPTADLHPPKPTISLALVTPSLPPPAEQIPQANQTPTIQPPPAEKPVQSREAPPPAPSTPAVSSAATGDGLRRGGSRPANDPGHQSDSESDAFSKLGNVKFLSDGRLDVQFGRKVKTTRPHIPVVGIFDSIGLRDPAVTLQVSVDATGKVTEVTVEKTSGSTAIDTPCLEAMYDWWFEPLVDGRGKPRPDSFLFTIEFR